MQEAQPGPHDLQVGGLPPRKVEGMHSSQVSDVLPGFTEQLKQVEDPGHCQGGEE